VDGQAASPPDTVDSRISVRQRVEPEVVTPVGGSMNICPPSVPSSHDSAFNTLWRIGAKTQFDWLTQ
jgi:hypothetical protein